MDMWPLHYNKLRRLFTVLAHEDYKIFILTLEDLEEMYNEYREYYDEIFDSALIRL
jgi:hypothetical protein